MPKSRKQPPLTHPWRTKPAAKKPPKPILVVDRDLKLSRELFPAYSVMSAKTVKAAAIKGRHVLVWLADPAAALPLARELGGRYVESERRPKDLGQMAAEFRDGYLNAHTHELPPPTLAERVREYVRDRERATTPEIARALGELEAIPTFRAIGQTLRAMGWRARQSATLRPERRAYNFWQCPTGNAAALASA